MKKIAIIFFTLYLLSWGQVKIFTDNPATFLQELTNMYNEIEQKDARKEGLLFVQNVVTPWWNGQLTEQQKKQIIQTCNNIFKRKFKLQPHVESYLRTLIDMSNAGKLTTAFTPWNQSVEKLLTKGSGSSLLKYFNTTDSLFMGNYLYISNSTKWIASHNQYDFLFEDEPVVVFNRVNITCYAYGDSSVIYETSGKFYPLQNMWYGKGGKVFWTRAGLNPNSVYAQLNNYKIELKGREFNADSVTFYNKDFFGETPLFGMLSDKLSPIKKPEDARYPVFKSYGTRFQLKDIYKNIDYEGGFTQRGASILGTGDENEPAVLYLKKDGKVFMKIYTQSVSIKKETFNSDEASIKIYFEGDSIYHNFVAVSYIQNRTIKDPNTGATKTIEVNEVSIIPKKIEGLGTAPFIDTYHKLEIYAEELRWQKGEPKLDFTTIKGPASSGFARFESFNYFSVDRYERLRGIDEIPPIQTLKNYAQTIGSRFFHIKDYAKYRKTQIEQIQAQMIELAYKNFVDYNPRTGYIFVQDKVYDYIACRAGKQDYDVIIFNSEISAEANASLSLINYDLKLRGVSRVFLSDSQNVVIYPTDQEIIVKKNRDFLFSGRVHAGLFDYYGKNFSFSYEKFKLDLPVIDSMTFKVRSRKPNEYGEYPLVRVKSVVENLSGDLLIDHPNNKSGLKQFSEYPIFNSKKYSYVYYDVNSKYPGRYPRDQFFYRLDPFTIDSLDNFSTDGLEFKGYLQSAGIFPDIVQPLKVMPDYSLGFIHQTPPKGLATYGGKGSFEGLINLSNQGLRGEGTLTYLSSTSKGNDFLFFPDLMTATVKDYYVQAQKSPVSVPPVEAHDVKEVWYPQKNELTVITQNTPATLYKEETHLTGELTLTPSGLTGKGKMEFKNATITSRLFKYKERTFDTDTCDFFLKTMDFNELAFETKNYKGHVDFDERKGEFKSNGGSSLVKFPVNEYICYMDQFDWYMDKDEIDMQNIDKQMPTYENLSVRELADIDLSGSEFISVHPAQDSLRFKSTRAKYNLKEKIIYAYDVKYIKVADATIFPGDGNVTILRKAEMLPLENAQILANNTTKYHLIKNARVNIFGRKSYKARGYYDYVDEIENLQKIYLDSITVDPTLQTIGHGYIKDSMQFTLSPNFDFYGDVFLKANEEFLTFSGGVRIQHQCDTFPRQWLKFTAPINPMEIFIPVSENPVNTAGKRIYAGLYFNSSDTIGVYPAFLSYKRVGGDAEVASSSGFLTYDKQSNEYRIASREKLEQPILPGNWMSLSVFKCETKNEGKLTLGSNLGRVKMTNYGRIDHSMKDTTTNIYTVSELNFHFNNECIKRMAELIKNNTDLESFNVRSELFIKYLGMIFPPEESQKIESEYMLYGYLKKFPSNLEKTITFTDITFQYNKKTRSYVSKGKIGIGWIGSEQIYKYVDGIIELTQRRGGDRLTMYFSVGSDWFFFDYANNSMLAISSIKEWNDLIINTKPEQRELKSKDNEPAYNYYIAPISRKNRFLKKHMEGENLKEENTGDE